MNILFICGSLEPGHDGVGDYTRRLGTALIQKGNNVQIIAINDTKVTTAISQKQGDDNEQIAVLRLSSSQSWDERLKLSKKYIDDFNPDWISLQYVPFSFHKRGLPWSLGKNLKKIGKGRKFTIMFHELWCGMNAAAPFKEKILGAGQRLVLKKTVAALKPQQIFTSIESYSKMLNDVGLNAVKVIPIFGNIPVDAKCNENEWKHFVEEIGLQRYIAENKAVVSIGFFGAVYPCPGLEDVLINVVTAARQTNREVVVFFIGHGNRAGIIEHLQNSIANVSFINIGALTPVLLNKMLSIIDAGIITTPSDGINKSGSAIAWIERGIPVLVSGKDASYNAAELKKYNVFKVTGSNDVIDALNAAKNKKVKSRLADVASFYTENLK